MANALLKGHLMNRGTLMVLKRLLVTTLGALGMGALATGPASAQQIPAPDLFDGQVACSSNVPAGMADAALGMALAKTLKDGTAPHCIGILMPKCDPNDDGNPGRCFDGPELHHSARE